MRTVQRQEHRLEQKQILCAPCPPDAATGVEGMRIADEILKRLHTPGLLIGGCARDAWAGKHRGALERHKDVDVVVLSQDASQHPETFVGGIDWWITMDPKVGPTNGNGAELIYTALCVKILDPGLYLAHPMWLDRWRKMEKSIWQSSHKFPPFRVPADRTTSLLPEYPVNVRAITQRFVSRDRWHLG